MNQGDGGRRDDTKAVAKAEKKDDALASFVKGDVFKERAMAALPKYIDQRHWLSAVLTSVRRNPDLLKCNVASVAAALMDCAHYGLTPGSSFGLAHLVPFKRECQLIIDFKGYIECAWRAAKIIIRARAIFTNDEYEYEDGLTLKFRHRPTTTQKPGDIVATYAIATMEDGRSNLYFLPRWKIDDIKAHAKSAKFWGAYFEEMAIKSAVRRLWKYIPKTPEMISMAERDGADEGFGGISPSAGTFSDVFPDDDELVACSEGDCGAVLEEIVWLETAQRHGIDPGSPLCNQHLAAREAPPASKVEAKLKPQPVAQMTRDEKIEAMAPPPANPPVKEKPPESKPAPSPLPRREEKSQEPAKPATTAATPPAREGVRRLPDDAAAGRGAGDRVQPAQASEQKAKAAPVVNQATEDMRASIRTTLQGWGKSEVAALDRQLGPKFGATHTELLQNGGMKELAAMAELIEAMG